MSTPMSGTRWRSGSWLAVVAISRRLVVGLRPSQLQPEPWMPAVAPLNCFLNAARGRARLALGFEEGCYGTSEER